MLSKLRARLTYANVMSTIACFVAIGTGGAYAANTVFSTDIVDGEVKNADIASSAVTSAKLYNGSVLNADLGLNAVTSDKVATNALSGADINESSLAKVPAATTADRLGPPEAWHAVGATSGSCSDPTYTGQFCGATAEGWTNFGGGHATAAFYKDQLGIVHLRGLIKGHVLFSPSAARRSIFRLPASYRPTALRVFPSVGGLTDTDVAIGRIDVAADGLVQLVQDCGADGCSANGYHVTLDGIAFRPDG